MSGHRNPSWSVLASPSTPAADRCVDVFIRPDGTFGFEEFRRDPEDMGTWTPVAYYSTRQFETEDDALSAARDAVSWLPGVLDARFRARAEKGCPSSLGVLPIQWPGAPFPFRIRELFVNCDPSGHGPPPAVFSRVNP